jgi:DedD protein
MAERIADNAEVIVDEMRRKARRRLVGAIVLALAAAIILPMLLEKEPRPLGDDVSVQIPPVDQGKFVNRLTGKAGETKPAAKSDSKPITAPSGKAETRADGTAEAPATPMKETAVAPKAESAASPKAEAAAAPKTETAGAAKPDAAAAASAESKGDAKAPAKSDARPAAEASAEPKTTVATTAPTTSHSASTATTPPLKPEGFVVQLAAFADDKGANALANKLKKNGYSAYVEPVNTSRGTLWRVRVGGYGTRPEADVARAALKGEGYNGIVTSSQ